MKMKKKQKKQWTWKAKKVIARAGFDFYKLVLKNIKTKIKADKRVIENAWIRLVNLKFNFFVKQKNLIVYYCNLIIKLFFKGPEVLRGERSNWEVVRGLGKVKV